MNYNSSHTLSTKFFTTTISIIAFVVFLFISSSIFAQSEFSKIKRDKDYKKGTNIEYWKNGNIKCISEYKRKVFWYYTDTYWTIKEYDMEGNQIRLVKKITQIGRREDRERIIKEEIYDMRPKKDNQNKDDIRPSQNE
jgi:hypothetical protein